MTFWICVPPRPPHSFGQWMPTKPASALLRWNDLARSIAAGRVLTAAIAFHRARLAAFGVGFQEGAGLGAECGLFRGVFEIHHGVLPQSVGSAIVLLRAQFRDQPALPLARTAECQRVQLGAAVIELAVHLPGEAHVSTTSTPSSRWAPCRSASSSSASASILGVGPWAEPLLEGATPTVFTSTTEINFEQIASLQPDLIVAVTRAITPDDYAKFIAAAL